MKRVVLAALLFSSCALPQPKPNCPNCPDCPPKLDPIQIRSRTCPPTIYGDVSEWVSYYGKAKTVSKNTVDGSIVYHYKSFMLIIKNNKVMAVIYEQKF